MGQNIPQNIESKNHLTQNWLPHLHESNVLVHKFTHQQVQRHVIKILIKDLPREIAHFASRMSNHQPQICRLLYFHPTVPDSRPAQDERQFRQMHLYTDKMIPLKYWNKDKLIPALNGFKKLVSIHGPIKISQGMICQNQKGQVKVWISQNPVNNHPDSKYMSQEQTVANLAAILTKRNKDLASLLLGCNTLKDTLQKIIKCNRESQGFSNYSHKASQSQDFHVKKVEFIEKAPNLNQYRNVFGEKPQLKNTNNKEMYKNCLKRPEEEHKPGSHISYASRNIEHYQTTIQRSAIDETSGKKKFTLETNTELKKVKTKEELFNNKSTSNLQFANIHRSISKNDPNNPNNRNTFEGRPTNLQKFENNRFSKNEQHFASQKGLKNNSWQPYEPQSTFGMPNRRQTTNHEKSFNGSTANNTSKTPNKSQNNGKKPYDITIINNNVSNYINTVVHNHRHVHKLQKKSSMPTNGQEQRNSHDPLHSSHKPEAHDKNEAVQNNQKNKERLNFVPIFIQQKKRVNTTLQETSPPQKKSGEDGFITRQDTMKSDFTNLSNLIESPTINLFLEKKQRGGQQSPKDFVQRNFERKSQKVYTFSRYNQPNASLHKYYNPVQTQTSEFYPKTPPPNNTVYDNSFNKYQKNIQNRPTYLGDFRTKTTDFYQKTSVRQNRQKVQAKAQKNVFAPKDKMEKIDIRINKIEQIPEAKEDRVKEDNKRPQTPQQKSNLKKQIKQEFSFLLGGDSPVKEQQTQEKTPKLMKRSEIIEVKRSSQDVTQKIAKKQIQFAQLKKMAQELLI